MPSPVLHEAESCVPRPPTHLSPPSQAWLARLDYSLNLSLQLYCVPDGHQSQGCALNERYTFPLHLLHPSLIPTLTTHTTLLHSDNSTTEQTGPFQYGTLALSVELYCMMTLLTGRAGGVLSVHCLFRGVDRENMTDPASLFETVFCVCR